MAVSVITVNIEGHHHLDRVIPFLRAEAPDVICLQEVFAQDYEQIASLLGMHGQFVPMMRVEAENKYRIAPLGEWGLALLTRLPHTPIQLQRYSGEGERLPVFAENPNDPWRVLLTTAVEKDGTRVVVGTTHFTWSPQGNITDEQRRDFEALSACISEYKELLLCGDFNAPRGRELRALFQSSFVDVIPESVTSTLDPLLHYAGPLNLVVDAIFSRGYSVENVRVVPGVSDHQAVCATVLGPLG